MKKVLVITANILFTFAIIGGCALYTNPKVQPLDPPAKFKNEIRTANKNVHLNPDWWKNFHDAQLNTLVTLALQNNLDYKIALKNIEIARTYVTQNFSSFFPVVDLSYSSARKTLSQNDISRTFISTQQGTTPNTNTAIGLGVFNTHQLDASVAYELDFWHRIANSVKQAKANVKISEANSNIVRLSLLSSVVNTYFQIVNLNESIDNLKQQYATINDIAKETNNQYKSGLLNISPLMDAKIQAEAIKGNIDNLQRTRQILQNTLAYLCGEYPEKFSFIINRTRLIPQRTFVALMPPALPSTMLLERPDVQGALYQVLSFGYAKKQTLASFFPTFALTGNYGYASNDLSNLISNGSKFWDYGFNALVTVFDYKNRLSQYKRSKLQFDAAMLTYKTTAINAFTEVDNALLAYQRDSFLLKTLQRELEFSANKYSISLAQYHAGMTSYSTYLAYKLAYLQNQYNVIIQNLVLTNDVVQIYKSLGLGLLQ